MHQSLTVRLIALTLALLPSLSESADSQGTERFLRLDQQGQPISANVQIPGWSCVLDRQTGLVWEVKTSTRGLHFQDNLFSWNQDRKAPQQTHCDNRPCTTRDYIQAVNQEGWCGAHDWRLPEREELRSLVDYGIPYPGPTIDHRYFPHTRPQFYWAANANASETEEAWGVGFAFGFDYAYYTTDRVRVRLVRGKREKGTPSTDFRLIKLKPNNTSIDFTTGLVWARCSVGMQWDGKQCRGKAQTLSWPESVALAKNGWRIPSLKELSSLVDLTKANPAIDSRSFPNTPAENFWTATPFINNPDMSWRVHFREGEAHGVKNKEPAYLRLIYDPK
jgi:hypothetical protein